MIILFFIIIKKTNVTECLQWYDNIIFYYYQKN